MGLVFCTEDNEGNEEEGLLGVWVFLVFLVIFCEKWFGLD